jgi:23S rRNA (uracil1939-C5)-methyltransferase
LQLTIEKMIYGGDGLARMPADAKGKGKAVFVPFVLPGEQVEASLRNEKPGYAQARLEKVVTASPQRIEPNCPYFQQCGGCNYQHTDYENQLAIKADTLKENLRRIGKIELSSELQIHPSPPWNYRNRARLKIRISPSFAIGYYKFASHELLPIEKCPISSPAINEAISKLWELGRGGLFPQGMDEIEIFADADDSQLLIEIYCDTPPVALEKFITELQRAVPQTAGVVVFRSVRRAAPGAELQVLANSGATNLSYRTEHASYQVSAGAFFQVNRHLTDELVRLVTDGRSGELALDLYAGVGLFSSALAKNFAQVIAVEASPISHADLRYNLPPNVRAVRAATEQYLVKMKVQAKMRGESADYIVVDPPRSGLGETLVQLLGDSKAPRITYVSCDPATLAHDLRGLLAAGYNIEQAHFIDLFPQTYHVESVFHLHLAR